MTTIENREFKVTFKGVAAYTVIIGTIISTAIYVKNSLQDQITAGNNHQILMDSVTSVKIRQMEVQIEQIRNDVLINRKVIEQSK